VSFNVVRHVMLARSTSPLLYPPLELPTSFRRRAWPWKLRPRLIREPRTRMPGSFPGVSLRVRCRPSPAPSCRCPGAVQEFLAGW